MDSGERLKLVRAKLGMTTREVALFSKLIAEAEGNNEFLVSGPWLTQIENSSCAIRGHNRTTPGATRPSSAF